MWLRECWQVAAFSHEISSTIVARRLLDEPVILYCTSSGTVTALADRCAHRGLPLSLGKLVGDNVQCGYHGMCYDPTGRCVAIPGQDAIPAAAIVRSYPIVERYKLIWIWMGERANANPALVPDVHWFEDPAWTPLFGYHHVAADYRLLNDNLLDLSHESFVHGETIGNRAVADSPVEARIIDGTVRVHRFMANCEPPPLITRSAGFSENIDRWHTTIYTPPGYCLIENGSMPAGSDKSHAKDGRVINLITPETATSSHYFWGFARSYNLDDTALTVHMQERIAVTFDQDQVLLEAQQRSLGSDDAFPVSIKVDAGPILRRRLLETAIEDEARRRRSIA